MVTVWQQMAESNMILFMRLTLGNKRTADILFDNEIDEEAIKFGQRHSRQMSTLIKAYVDSDAYRKH